MKDLKPATYKISKFCMEPTAFKVKEESQFANKEAEFVKTKLMTRLTYTLDEVHSRSCSEHTGFYPAVSAGLYLVL